MTPTDLDAATHQALLEMDPAPAATDLGQQSRADAVLARILATDPTPPPAAVTGRPRRRGRRLAVVGALAVATGAGLVGAELFGGGDPAYASWTATPHQPSASQKLATTAACRASLIDSLRDTPQIDPSGVTLRALQHSTAVLAEQRGDWTLVVLGDAGGLDASCVVQHGTVSSGNSWSALAYRDPMQLAPRDIWVTSGGTGGSRDNLKAVVIGFVGADVTGVTVHTADYGDVTATVSNGHLAAWWPGPKGLSVTDSSLNKTAVQATIHYSDGTTQTRSLDLGHNHG